MFRGGLPVFIEYSWVPRLLSRFSPIEIGAITLGPFVFGRSAISSRTRIHESIHWGQYKETGVILFPILYALFWAFNLFKFNSMAQKLITKFLLKKKLIAMTRTSGTSRRKLWAWARKD